MCASPAAADETKTGINSEPIYLFRFPIEALKEVILGHRMWNESKEAIIKIVRRSYPNARTYVTALNELEYDLTINPIP
jgi:hypothetical protein